MEVPIVRVGVPDDKNGRIIYHGANPAGEGWDTVYSFTYYYVPDKRGWKRTIYFWGLSAYIQMINNWPFYGKTGIVIYTNPVTLTFLQEAFPQEIYPNIIFAVPFWPAFSNDAGELDVFILRTMRYQAVDHFRAATVHIRDADTLFTSIYYSDIGDDDFAKLLLDWESRYTEFVAELEASGKQIILGSVKDYRRSWHSNLVYPIDFPYPFQKISENNFMSNMQEEKHIFVKKANFKTPIRYSLLFDEKYFFTPKIGVFAGFSTVTRNRDGIEPFWLLCVQYMVSRYIMTTPVYSEENGKQLTNWQIKSAFEIGKDERMLLYAIIPAYFERIFFLNINYGVRIGVDHSKINSLRGRKMYLFYFPEYFDQFQADGSDPLSAELRALFQAQRDSYLNWLTQFKETYPTEKNFLNAVNANFESIVPNNGKTYKVFEKYGKKVIRRGGRRTRTSTRRRHSRKF